MLTYWKMSRDKNNYVYSCDMIRLALEFTQDGLNVLNRFLSNGMRLDIKMHKPNFSDFKFKYLFTFDYGESTMTLGLCFNGCNKADNLRGFIEVNPNKCFNSTQCHIDITNIIDSCLSYEFSRWDLAIDIPIDRGHVMMGKDNRKFELHQRSFLDRTEYLGQRNKEGRVKIYNKQFESKLDYKLTRVELTLGSFNNVSNVLDKILPDIFFNTEWQNNLLLDNSLSETQKILVELIRNDPNPLYYLKRVPYRQRKKIEPYVLGKNKQFNIDISSVYKIISYIEQYFKHKVFE